MVRIFPIGKMPIKTALGVNKGVNRGINNSVSRGISANSIQNTVALPALTALALIATAPALTNCTKTLDIEAKSAQDTPKVVKDFDSMLNVLGIMKSNSTVKVIDNICFEDTEGYEYWLENIQTSETDISFKFSKIRNNILEETSNVTLSSDKDFLSLGLSTKSGKNIDKKFSILDEKVIEYTQEEGFFIPKSDYIKTDNGFRQNLNDGSHKDFTDIKLNTNLSSIRITVDTTCNVVEHHITL